jgi:hypothetical protein
VSRRYTTADRLSRLCVDGRDARIQSPPATHAF